MKGSRLRNTLLINSLLYCWPFQSLTQCPLLQLIGRARGGGWQRDTPFGSHFLLPPFLLSHWGCPERARATAVPFLLTIGSVQKAAKVSPPPVSSPPPLNPQPQSVRPRGLWGSPFWNKEPVRKSGSGGGPEFERRRRRRAETGDVLWLGRL